MLLFAAVLCAFLSLPVYDHPAGEAFLLYQELPDGTARVALSLDGETPATGYVHYPQPFNPAKTDAFYHDGDATLEIYSQMPFTAVSTTAVFRLEGGVLTLLDSGVMDPYGSAYEEIAGSLARDDLEGALYEVYDLFYPQAMPTARELCLLFLHTAFRCDRSGGGMSCYLQAEEASQILLGRDLHQILSPGETLPEHCISASQYNDALEGYARALEAAGNPILAGTVREAKLRP